MAPNAPAEQSSRLPAGVSPAASVRVRAKLEMRGEILAAARRALAQEGPAGLSFRAVAREVGLVSSAVYRYFPSRDALLTALIVESYDGLGDQVEAAERDVPRTAFAGRYRAVARAARRWARDEPHQWTLIFGSPVPGYDAPTETVRAATRVPLTLACILRDAHTAGAVKPAESVLEDVHEALELRTALADPVPDQLLVRGLVAWTYILGAITTELFGHRHRVVSPPGADAVFEYELDEMVVLVGFLDLNQQPGDPGRLSPMSQA